MIGATSRPIVIADRGASSEAPENTIAAFELALDQGADGLELQVHLSLDDQPVVIRDFTLERTTDGAGLVRARRLKELKRLDAGGWRGERFRGQRLQTLGEVLERFRDRTRFWIELPAGSERYRGIEERVVSLVEIYDVLDRCLVQSSDRTTLDELRGLNRDLTLAARVVRAEPPDGVEGPGLVQALCAAAHGLTGPSVAAIRAAGFECYAWTVDEPALASRLVGWGIDGIISGQPGPIRAAIGHPDSS